MNASGKNIASWFEFRDLTRRALFLTVYSQCYRVIRGLREASANPSKFGKFMKMHDIFDDNWKSLNSNQLTVFFPDAFIFGWGLYIGRMSSYALYEEKPNTQAWKMIKKMTSEFWCFVYCSRLAWDVLIFVYKPHNYSRNSILIWFDKVWASVLQKIRKYCCCNETNEKTYFRKILFFQL